MKGMSQRELELIEQRDNARKDLEAKNIELAAMRSKFESETKMLGAFRDIEKELEFWRAEPHARTWPEPREMLERIDKIVLDVRKEKA